MTPPREVSTEVQKLPCSRALTTLQSHWPLCPSFPFIPVIQNLHFFSIQAAFCHVWWCPKQVTFAFGSMAKFHAADTSLSSCLILFKGPKPPKYFYFSPVGSSHSSLKGVMQLQAWGRVALGVGSGQGGVCESVPVSVQQEILRTSAMGNPIPHGLVPVIPPPHLARARWTLGCDVEQHSLWSLVFLLAGWEMQKVVTATMEFHS